LCAVTLVEPPKCDIYVTMKSHFCSLSSNRL